MAGDVRRRGGRAGEQGAAAVEFALVSVLLFTLFFALVQYGFYFWAVQGASSAAREAARRAAVGQPATCATFEAEVMPNIESMAVGSIDITRLYSSAAVAIGDDVTVNVAFDSVDFGFPFLPFIDDGRVAEAATSRVEHVPDPAPGNCT